MTPTKTCGKCKTAKPLADFRTCRRMKDGHLNTCRACEAAYSARYRTAGPQFTADQREDLRSFGTATAADSYARRSLNRSTRKTP